MGIAASAVRVFHVQWVQALPGKTLITLGMTGGKTGHTWGMTSPKKHRNSLTETLELRCKFLSALNFDEQNMGF